MSEKFYFLISKLDSNMNLLCITHRVLWTRDGSNKEKWYIDNINTVGGGCEILIINYKSYMRKRPSDRRISTKRFEFGNENWDYITRN